MIKKLLTQTLNNNTVMIFMPPTSKKLVEGAYWFGSVRAVSLSVSQSVCDA